VQSGDPTVRFVRAWVPAGATLRVKRAGRASLVAWNWWFQAEYAVEHTVFAADGVTELDESGWPITVHADGSTPGMPGWKFFGPSDYPVFTNHSASGREVVVRVTTDETGGGAGLEWRGTFYSKLDGSVVEGNPPRCPTSTRPDTETDRPGWSLKRSCAARTDEGDPIDTRTGNFWFGLPGLSVSGRGAGLGFGLMFSSSDAAVDGPTGFGWSSLLSMRVRVDGSDAVTVVEETGATVPFSKTGGVWGAPGRFSAGLVESPGGGWVFTRNHFEVFRFDAAGLLVGFGDQFGNETTLSYGSGGQVEFMEDEAGRRLVFEWDGARLDSVADDPLVGDRSIQFGYDPAGNLTSFTDVGDGVWSFGYDGEHRVIRVRKPGHQPAGPGGGELL
jgi:YD repeat-containing protein